MGRKVGPGEGRYGATKLGLGQVNWGRKARPADVAEVLPSWSKWERKGCPVARRGKEIWVLDREPAGGGRLAQLRGCMKWVGGS